MNYKYKFKLSGLDCANCARRIETALNENEKIIKGTVNFAKLTITIETPLQDNVKQLVQKIVNSIEPNIKVLDEKEEIKNNIKFDIGRLIIGIILFIISLIIKNNIIHEILIIAAYLILLFRVLKKAIFMLIKSFSIDENLLITISCVGAYFTNNIHEGLMVILLYEIGKILESLAVNNSRKSISELMNIKPEYANLKFNDKLYKVKPELVKLNSLIVVKQGEKVPLDGIVVEGTCKLDKRALTGESNLVTVKENEAVLSGSINTSGVITVKVTELYENSTVSQILNLVENASDKKAKTENFVSKAAKIYTPIILLLAILIIIFLPLFSSITFSDAIYRALVFLVVSCPCAIAISVPLSYFSGIGASSKKGILIKGSNYLEAAASIKEIIFDKTGTITTGNFHDYALTILDQKYSQEEIIKYYISGEMLSNHPIAHSILNLFENKKPFKISNFEEIPGKGIDYTYRKQYIKIGSANFCDSKDLTNAIYLNINNKLVAKLLITDGIKENAQETIAILKKLGLNVKMFTGDEKNIALNIAKKVGIENIEYELLPKDKFELLENEIKKYKGNVAFVGDGINDAPALRIAKIGISMGSIGSEAAIEASDVVIMNDNLDSLIALIKISKKTNKIIKQNLVFSIGIKVLILLLSTLGLASMWMAVFADTGVTLLTILNTTRILKDNKREK